MKRLVFIVEGDTEIVLVQNLIVPYLVELGFRNTMHAQTIITNRKQHKKGGVVSYELVIDDDLQLQQIDAIIKEFPNPEDINNSPDTAPSKRLKKIFNYDKTGDGELIFDMIGIENMINKCPRFAGWLESLVAKLSSGY